jgi:glycosyltransferase involved in cell wall biosynthesis
MKVCIISHSAVVDVYREKFHQLADLGLEVHLVLPAGWPEGNHWVKAPPAGYEKGVYVSVFPVRWAGKVGGFYLPGLKSWLSRLQPDILHLEEEPYALIGMQALRALPSQKRRVVFFTWENILRRYKWPLAWVDRWMLKQARWAIAGNHEAEHVLRQRGFGGSVAVIPQYGVNPKIFKPRETQLREQFTIGFFGRLQEEKGIHTLLRAAAALKFTFRVTITGRGAYESALRSQVARLSLNGRVEFQPLVPNDKMPAALSQLDVLVLPSETRPEWKEQFGRVLTEAMACGVPVVGSNSGEIPHVIGDAGLIFPESDAPALAKYLTMLYESPAWRADLAQRGRKRVEANFTTKRIALATHQFYQQIMEA